MITASICADDGDGSVRAALIIDGASIGECTLWPGVDGLEVVGGCITRWADEQLVAHICAIEEQSDRRILVDEIIAAVTLADAEYRDLLDEDEGVAS